MNRLIIIILLSSFQVLVTGQENGSIELIKDHIERFGQADIQFVNPGRIELSRISERISVYSANNEIAKALVSEAHLVYMASFPYNYKIIEPQAVKAALSALSVSEAMNWDRYPTWPQYDTIMKKFAEDFPGICRLDTIGETINGKSVIVLKISDNPYLDEDEPEVFYSATIHGDELASYVLTLRLADHLLNMYSENGYETTLIDSLEIWINPLANPDGTYFSNDTIASPRRFNANGIDLNRNFPDPTSPAIVQENADMIEFLKERKFVLSANFHSGAEVLNFPWDRGVALWDGRIHADSSWFFDICKQYVDTVHLYSTPTYLTDLYSTLSYPGVTRGDDWYEVRGSRQDYVNFERQGREITMELAYVKDFPASNLHSLWDYNYRSLLRYLGNAMYGIHGKVVDDATDKPLEAKIFIDAYDRDSSHIYSDTISGSFVRLLDENSWDLTISIPGYQTAYINSIETIDFNQKYIEVRLTKDTSDIPFVKPERILIWPVPVSDRISIKLPVGFGTELGVEIISSSGKVVYRKTHFLTGEYLENIPVRDLAGGLYIVNVRNQSGKTVSGSIVVR